MKFNNRNIYIGKNVKLGENVKLGDNVTIYDNVSIGKNSIVCNDCVVGEPMNDYYYDENYINPETIIGDGALIRSHTIIYCGSEFGEKMSTGHRVTIREKCIVGRNFSIGTISDMQGYTEVGNYCRFHSNVHIGQQSKIGNFVFIYPYVVLTNDPHPPSNICKGPTIGDFSQIAVLSVILPNVKLGKHVLIGAGSVVSKNVDDFMLVAGNPAKLIKDTREIISRETGKSHYPWPYNFSRGMPWEGQDFDIWSESNYKNE